MSSGDLDPAREVVVADLEVKNAGCQAMNRSDFQVKSQKRCEAAHSLDWPGCPIHWSGAREVDLEADEA